MTGVQIGEDMAFRVFSMVNDHFENRSGFVVVFRRDQQVVLVINRLAEFSAVGLVELDVPMWVHGR